MAVSICYTRTIDVLISGPALRTQEGNRRVSGTTEAHRNLQERRVEVVTVVHTISLIAKTHVRTVRAVTCVKARGVVGVVLTDGRCPRCSTKGVGVGVSVEDICATVDVTTFHVAHPHDSKTVRRRMGMGISDGTTIMRRDRVAVEVRNQQRWQTLPTCDCGSLSQTAVGRDIISAGL